MDVESKLVEKKQVEVKEVLENTLAERRRVRHVARQFVFSFGMIGDVQYATDCEKGLSYFGDEVRWYQDSLNKLKKAVICWNKHPELNFCVNMGDLIDKRNVDHGNTAKAYEDCEKVLEQINCKLRIDLLGNHEFYNWPTRKDIPRGLNISQVHRGEQEARTWYSYIPSPGWRVIILDSYGISAIEGSPNQKETLEYLNQYNPNNLSVDTGDWYKDVKKEYLHMVPFNGGLGPEQLHWLEGQLSDMFKNKERGIILTHVPIMRKHIGEDKLIDCEKVQTLLQRYRCIKAVFTGHIHTGSYFFDRTSGVHHYSIFCPLLADKEDECHSIIYVCNDRISVRGFGKGVFDFDMGFDGSVEEVKHEI